VFEVGESDDGARTNGHTFQSTSFNRFQGHSELGLQKLEPKKGYLFNAKTEASPIDSEQKESR
jgi:hypothetical protein